MPEKEGLGPSMPFQRMCKNEENYFEVIGTKFLLHVQDSSNKDGYHLPCPSQSVNIMPKHSDILWPTSIHHW